MPSPKRVRVSSYRFLPLEAKWDVDYPNFLEAERVSVEGGNYESEVKVS